MEEGQYSTQEQPSVQVELASAQGLSCGNKFGTSGVMIGTANTAQTESHREHNAAGLHFDSNAEYPVQSNAPLFGIANLS